MLLARNILTLDLNDDRNMSSFIVGDILCKSPELLLLLSNTVAAGSCDVELSAPKNILRIFLRIDTFSDNSTCHIRIATMGSHKESQYDDHLMHYI